MNDENLPLITEKDVDDGEYTGTADPKAGPGDIPKEAE